MNHSARTSAVLTGLIVLFAVVAAGFFLNLWGRPAALGEIPLVEAWVNDTATVRTNFADLIRMKEDLSDFDCYGCHEKNKPPVLKFDADHNLVIPKEHSNITMGHGSHNRNNLCYNCHNEANLELLQTRDGRELRMDDSTPLCGSCHGPTYRDWEAGAHGRTSGYWDRDLGAPDRKGCVSCHNPHSPKFPPRKPAPGPHPLRPAALPAMAAERSH